MRDERGRLLQKGVLRLAKLLKYELRARVPRACAASVAVLGITLAVLSVGPGWDPHGIVLGILMSVLSIVIIAAPLVVFHSAYQGFVELFCRRGYLWLSLPATMAEQLLSKLIAAVAALALVMASEAFMVMFINVTPLFLINSQDLTALGSIVALVLLAISSLMLITYCSMLASALLPALNHLVFIVLWVALIFSEIWCCYTAASLLTETAETLVVPAVCAILLAFCALFFSAALWIMNHRLNLV